MPFGKFNICSPCCSQPCRNNLLFCCTSGFGDPYDITLSGFNFVSGTSSGSSPFYSCDINGTFIANNKLNTTVSNVVGGPFGITIGTNPDCDNSCGVIPPFDTLPKCYQSSYIPFTYTYMDDYANTRLKASVPQYSKPICVYTEVKHTQNVSDITTSLFMVFVYGISSPCFEGSLAATSEWYQLQITASKNHNLNICSDVINFDTFTLSLGYVRSELISTFANLATGSVSFTNTTGSISLVKSTDNLNNLSTLLQSSSVSYTNSQSSGNPGYCVNFDTITGGSNFTFNNNSTCNVVVFDTFTRPNINPQPSIWSMVPTPPGVYPSNTYKYLKILNSIRKNNIIVSAVVNETVTVVSSPFNNFDSFTEVKDIPVSSSSSTLILTPQTVNQFGGCCRTGVFTVA